MKMWMNRFREMCYNEGTRFPVTMTVHDELVMDVLKEEVPKFRNMLKESLLSVASELFPTVPFELDTVVGDSWGAKAQKEELEDD